MVDILKIIKEEIIKDIEDERELMICGKVDDGVNTVAKTILNLVPKDNGIYLFKNKHTSDILTISDYDMSVFDTKFIENCKILFNYNNAIVADDTPCSGKIISVVTNQDIICNIDHTTIIYYECVRDNAGNFYVVVTKDGSRSVFKTTDICKLLRKENV